MLKTIISELDRLSYNEMKALVAELHSRMEYLDRLHSEDDLEGGNKNEE